MRCVSGGGEEVGIDNLRLVVAGVNWALFLFTTEAQRSQRVDIFESGKEVEGGRCEVAGGR